MRASRACSVHGILAACLAGALCAAPGAAADEASHRAKAAAVLEITGIEGLFSAQTAQAVEALVAMQPGFGRYREVLHAYVAQYVTWDNVRGDFIDLYAAAFEESELDTLLAFYRTPAGSKSLRIAPRLATAVGLIMQRAVQNHAEMLGRMIRAEDRQREEEAQAFLRALGAEAP